jgi:alanine racemase
MDMMMIDITEARQSIGVGDKVALIGEGGDQKITAYELSLASGFIPYEILTILSPLIPRVLV